MMRVQKIKSKKMSFKSNKLILPTKNTSSSSSSLTKHLYFFFYSLLFISFLLFISTSETLLTTIATTRTSPTTTPKWFDSISHHFKPPNKPQIAVLLLDDVHDHHQHVQQLSQGLLNSQLTRVEFERVSPNITWRDLYPLWIDEDGNNNMKPKCPNIFSMKKMYVGVDIVLANISSSSSCGNNNNSSSSSSRVGVREVYRLQVSLMAAKVAAESGKKVVYVVFVGGGGGGCEPMLEMFRCDELVWYDSESGYWVYKPDLNRLKQKISLPIGSCEIATNPYNFQPEISSQESSIPFPIRSKGIITQQAREAYVTLLHSSELYVCGAIALAQSILQTNTTKDLVLLADDSITPRSINGLKAAGWKIKRIKRVRCPSAKKGHYNEWNCSKLRIWQLINYDKIVFIDADFIVLKNIDYLFSYPQLSASEDTMSIFNSGVMVVEPSSCLFDTLMTKRHTLNSYNGGDQGLLNEVFTWWHRITKKITFLKCFIDENDPREVPKDVYMIHFVGVKPWVCYRDYDCNWDQIDRHIFASDVVHRRWWQVYDALPTKLKPFCGLTTYMDANIRSWREIAKNNVSFSDTHWKIVVQDPRKHDLIDNDPL